ncbi:MAG: alpha/beta hydrolase [Gammaproteobacteria bacterium]|nr:alpha/beta hydrolase [Gammaproteobacteria bacterium]
MRKIFITTSCLIVALCAPAAFSKQNAFKNVLKAVSPSIDSAFTTVQEGVSLYSGYHYNPHALFPGTVIFFNGSGLSTFEWEFRDRFFSQIMKNYSFLMFDRSGLGLSPPNLNLSAKNTGTAKLMYEQLIELLKKRHIPGPYLLVAHSYAGRYAGYFALKNSSLVKGILFVDPSPRDYTYKKSVNASFAPAVSDAEKYSAQYMVDHYSGVLVEIAYNDVLGFKKTTEEIKALGAINNQIPVIILSSTGMEAINKQRIVQDWYTSQKQWLNHNPHSTIIQVKSGHCIQIDRPNVVLDQLNLLAKWAN